SGGTFTQDAWQTRPLTNVIVNEITGSSLGSNQITLPAGTYEVTTKAAAYNVASHQSRLRNVSDNATLTLSPMGYTSGTNNVQTSVSSGKFTLAAEKVLELQHYCQVTKATDGYGIGFNT